MNQYRIYRKDNYICITDNLTLKTEYGHVKQVFVDKSNTNKAAYRFFEIKDWDNTVSLVIDQILKEDGSNYTASEFDTFYTQNTGNFSNGGSGQGVQTVTGTSVDNTDPANPVINAVEEAPEDGETYGRQDGTWVVVSGGGGSQDLQQTLDNGDEADRGFTLSLEDSGDISTTTVDLGLISVVSGEIAGNKKGVDIENGQVSTYITDSVDNIYRGAGLGVNFDLDENPFGALILNNTEEVGYTLVGNNSVGATGGTFQYPAEGGTSDTPKTLATIEDFAPDITIVATGNHTIPDGVRTRIITLTDNNPQIVTLPAISDAIGSIYFITNDSTSTVDINSKSGGNDIWDGGLAFATKMATAGTPVRIINDGLNYKVL